MSSCNSSSSARLFRLQNTVKHNSLSMTRNCGLRNMRTNAFHTELDMPSHRAAKRTWPGTGGPPPICWYALMDISGVQHTQNDTINTNDVTCVGLDRFSDNAVTYSYVRYKHKNTPDVRLNGFNFYFFPLLPYSTLNIIPSNRP